MRKLIVFIIILLLIFIFLLKGENVFFDFLLPIQNFFYQLEAPSLSGDEFYNQLKIENVKLKKIQVENEIIRDHFNFLDETKDNSILARIIGQKSVAGFKWFLLDQGANNGIKPGLAVVDQNGVLIGVVAKVKDSISYSQPIFDQHLFLAVDIITYNPLTQLPSKNDISNPKIASGIIQGEYGLTLKIKYIPLDKKINIGDAVITTGLEDNIRWGIVIGQVMEINKKPNDIFQEVIVKPLLIPNPKIVSIILPQ